MNKLKLITWLNDYETKVLKDMEDNTNGFSFEAGELYVIHEILSAIKDGRFDRCNKSKSNA